jgi:hypothetical protein
MEVTLQMPIEDIARQGRAVLPDGHCRASMIGMNLSVAGSIKTGVIADWSAAAVASVLGSLEWQREFERVLEG